VSNGRQNRKGDRNPDLPWNGRIDADGFRMNTNGADDMLYDPKISRSRWPLPFRQQSWETLIALAFIIVLVGVVCANLPAGWIAERNAPAASVNHAGN
jgi:hypothetical protein